MSNENLKKNIVKKTFIQIKQVWTQKCAVQKASVDDGEGEVTNVMKNCLHERLHKNK
jgi:hypothetical protein